MNNRCQHLDTKEITKLRAIFLKIPLYLRLDCLIILTGQIIILKEFTSRNIRS